jgi:hypothetical protein
MDQEPRVAIVLGGEGRVVVDPVKKPGRSAEHEEVEGRGGALLDWSFLTDAGQGAHR